jgi:hypothetical protein
VRIVIPNDGQVELEDPNGFTLFSVAAANPSAAAVLDAMAGQASAAPEDDHVFVAVTAVRSLAGDHVDREWEAGMAKMLEFAGKNGWLNESGDAIKAHIEQL